VPKQRFISPVGKPALLRKSRSSGFVIALLVWPMISTWELPGPGLFRYWPWRQPGF